MSRKWEPRSSWREDTLMKIVSKGEWGKMKRHKRGRRELLQ